MKKFNSYEELLKEIGVIYSQEKKYFNDELNGFLEGVGSDIVDNENAEPKATFKVEFEYQVYEIGVTSIEISEEGDYKYFYWLED